MQYLNFGRTGLRPSRLGCGCSQIASLSTTHSPSEVHATLLEALDEGVNFFDTADIYGQGDSERLLGKLFKGQRDRVILCSKAGLTVGASQTLVRWIKPFVNPLVRHWNSALSEITSLRHRMERKCFEPAYLRGQLEASLSRLNTDYLDLFLLHDPPAEVLGDGPVLAMLQNLKRAGSIRHYGVSCDSTNQALAAMQHPDVSCLQVPVNPIHGGMTESVLPLARAKGVGIVAREPLAGGGVFRHPSILEICRDDPGCSPARVALRYSMQKEDDSVILAGMSCRRHLQENLKSLESPPLSTEQMAKLDAAVRQQPDRP